MSTETVANVLVERNFKKNGIQQELDGDGARNLVADLTTSQLQGDPGRIELMKELGKRENLVINADAAKVLGDYVPTLKGFEGERLKFKTVGDTQFNRFSVRQDGQLNSPALEKADAERMDEANGGRSRPPVGPPGEPARQPPGPPNNDRWV
jgi:hypothetical protein